MLVFVAGKQEISDMKGKLRDRGVSPERLEALHGDVAPEEIQRRTRGGWGQGIRVRLTRCLERPRRDAAGHSSSSGPTLRLFFPALLLATSYAK